MLKVGYRYFTNLVSRVASQQGYMAAANVGGKFVFSEFAKIPRLLRHYSSASRGGVQDPLPVMYSDEILNALADLNITCKDLNIDIEKLQKHIAECRYPKYYAAGPMSEGGAKEQKIIEYFVSLELLNVQAKDTVIDIASEWSVFPDILRNLTGAMVYRQDLKYPDEVKNGHIGGNAAKMPIPAGFANKLVLHNAFEHFEGTADSDFIREAWRVLKPGGQLCILPLFLAEKFSILTDPLVDCNGIQWDPEAKVIKRPWWHNRFGRFYDVPSLQRRVLTPGKDFQTTIYHIGNIKDVHPQANLHFALLMEKPLES